MIWQNLPNPCCNKLPKLDFNSITGYCYIFNLLDDEQILETKVQQCSPLYQSQSWQVTDRYQHMHIFQDYFCINVIFKLQALSAHSKNMLAFSSLPILKFVLLFILFKYSLV